ncbi:MAG TPA: alpha-D-ribose 1-methylphosphonate 5-triphosphate diphosphatase [Candidatus Binatia bacterium]|nr:alpha-D-ribose 1-methylphosphonate 5-triphosphate diphosphatase [Candidatus Binatia bacterium]
MSDVVLANAQVVTPDETFVGAVHVADGRIAAVERGARVPPGAVDAAGDLVMPGLVELHTDVLERHAFPRPGVHWPEAAAVVAYDAHLASSGITTSFDSLSVGYVIDTRQRPRDPRGLAEAIAAGQAQGRLRAEHFLHIRCEVATEGVVADYERLAADPLVRLVSLMDHTPGQRQFVNVDKYREYYSGKYGLSEPEIAALIDARRADHARYAGLHRAALAQDCQARGLTLVSHDDATLAHVEEAAKIGTAVAEFPTTLEAARAARAYGIAILAGAPNLVCGRSHSGNIAAADLADAGLLDILSSDYVPASLLHGAVLLHRRHGLGLPAALRTVTATPAACAGLDDRGALTPGRRADLLRVRGDGDLPIIEGVWRQGRRIA